MPRQRKLSFAIRRVPERDALASSIPTNDIDQRYVAVVYTCGAMKHNDRIILPYALSDTYSIFATVDISALMQSIWA